MEFYTDLACEKGTQNFDEVADDLEYGCEEIVININTTKKMQEYGKPKGKYYLLNCPNLEVLAPVVADYVANQLADYLRLTLGEKIGEKVGKILVVGLGNKDLVCDSLGVKTAENLIVSTFETGKNKNILTAFCPGVSGHTGIITSKLVKSVVQNTKADLVILVDSLCAISATRLGNSFQISDSGIVAGGAMGNNDEIMNSKFLGVPTIVMGTPLVIRTETIIGEVLTKLSDENIDIDQNIYKNISNLIVTPKEIDRLVSLSSYILGNAINLAVLGISLQDQKLLNF